LLLGKKEEEIFKKNDERKRWHAKESKREITKRDTHKEKKEVKPRAPSIFSPFVSFARDVSTCVRMRATMRRDQNKI